jgi:hypothetical protein
MASLEIAIRQCRDLRFITHLDIIRNASAQAQRAANGRPEVSLWEPVAFLSPWLRTACATPS